MASLTFSSCKNNAKGGVISYMIYSTQFNLLLVQALSNFTVLTRGDMAEMADDSILFGLLVMEKSPADEGISILDTDLEVDLAPPVVYVAPQRRKATPQPTSPLLPRVVSTRTDIYCSFFESAFISPAAARQSRRFTVVLYFRYRRSSAATSTCRKLHCSQQGAPPDNIEEQCRTHVFRNMPSELDRVHGLGGKGEQI